MFLHSKLPLLHIFVWGVVCIISSGFIDNPDPKLLHNTHTDLYMSALTCGDRAVGGWVKSAEWAADRKPCALLTDWCVRGADRTSCWSKNTQTETKKKQSNWGESQPKRKRANLKQPPSWAKKRLKIMRRESGCCVLSTILVTSRGHFLFRPSSNGVCGRSCETSSGECVRRRLPVRADQFPAAHRAHD